MKLGDAVHYVAQPVAKTIDLVFRTSLQTCQTCAKRRERLNVINFSGGKFIQVFTGTADQTQSNMPPSLPKP